MKLLSMEGWVKTALGHKLNFAVVSHCFFCFLKEIKWEQDGNNWRYRFNKVILVIFRVFKKDTHAAALLGRVIEKII